MFLVEVGSFRCMRQAELFWAAFETLLYQPFVVAAAVPTPLASIARDGPAGSHRIRLHLSFQSWLARCCGVAERNAPVRSQREKNRPQRRV